MTILSALRTRLSERSISATTSPPDGDNPSGSTGEAQAPFAGYDRLDARGVIEGLSAHSQVELEAVESYERSHKTRPDVLNKLRYMRGPEPLSGYDALSADEVVVVLGDAEMTTIKKVRGYERKFRNRSVVMEEVGRVHHQRLAEQPAAPAPAYQPLSAATGAAPRD